MKLLTENQNQNICFLQQHKGSCPTSNKMLAIMYAKEGDQNYYPFNQQSAPTQTQKYS